MYGSPVGGNKVSFAGSAFSTLYGSLTLGPRKMREEEQGQELGDISRVDIDRGQVP
jgi:hypothetical protein